MTSKQVKRAQAKAGSRERGVCVCVCPSCLRRRRRRRLRQRPTYRCTVKNKTLALGGELQNRGEAEEERKDEKERGMCWKQKTLEGKEGRVGTNYAYGLPTSGLALALAASDMKGKWRSKGREGQKRGGASLAEVCARAAEGWKFRVGKWRRRWRECKWDGWAGVVPFPGSRPQLAPRNPGLLTSTRTQQVA